jgi:uncharacterized 2Fe-2S/4Fe-4S cluster protein (DUF4445 family)
LSEYGVSIDLGTSQITIHLVELASSKVVGENGFENPQHFAGHDIISRIKFAMKDKSNFKRLTSAIHEGITRGIIETLESCNVSINQVNMIVIVGNTVMHHLFFGFSVESLGKPSYHTTRIDAIRNTTEDLNLELQKNIPIYSPPLVHSYIGADAIAMIVASQIINQTTPSIAIDIGTNTEIALWDGTQLRMCSAASGPAFEGMSLDCGSIAVEGAIYAVDILESDYRPVLHVIGGGLPKGICGTGVISTIASLLDKGVLDSKGSIQRGLNSPWIAYSSNVSKYILAHAIHSDTGKPIYISQVDLRMVQKSKAAIRGGIEYLLNYASCDEDKIEYVYITGAFGSKLNLQDAFRIGLFPYFSNVKVVQEAHGASKGADLFITNPSMKNKAETLAKKIEYIELIDNPKFHKFYVQAQMFDVPF